MRRKPKPKAVRAVDYPLPAPGEDRTSAMHVGAGASLATEPKPPKPLAHMRIGPSRLSLTGSYNDPCNCLG